MVFSDSDESVWGTTHHVSTAYMMSHFRHNETDAPSDGWNHVKQFLVIFAEDFPIDNTILCLWNDGAKKTVPLKHNCTPFQIHSRNIVNITYPAIKTP